MRQETLSPFSSSKRKAEKGIGQSNESENDSAHVGLRSANENRDDWRMHEQKEKIEKAEAAKILDKIYRYPADFEEAVAHAESFWFGYKPKKLANEEVNPRCPCCDNLLGTIPLSFCCYPTSPKVIKDEKIFLLPKGVSTYFIFIKMLIYYLVFRFLFFDVWVISFSQYGDYCSNLYHTLTNPADYCDTVTSGFNLTASGNSKELRYLDIANLVFTVVSLIYLEYCAYLIFELRQRLSLDRQSEDQYSIYVTEIPTIINRQKYAYSNQPISCEKFVRDEIIRSLDPIVKKLFEKQDLTEEQKKVKEQLNSVGKQNIFSQISVLYNCQYLKDLNEERQIVIQKFLKQEDKESAGQEILSELRLINSEYIEHCKKVTTACYTFADNGYIKLSNFTGSAIITFEYQQMKKYFLEQLKKMSEERQKSKEPNLNNFESPLKLCEVDKPEDIQWFQGIKSEKSNRQWLLKLYYFFFITLLATFLSLILIKYWEYTQEKYHYVDYWNQKARQYLPGLISIVAVLISNKVIRYTTSTLFQKIQSKGAKENGILILSVGASLYNSVFIYLIVFFVMNWTNLLGIYGIANKIKGLIWFSAPLSGIVLNLFPVIQLLTVFPGWFKYRKERSALQDLQKRRVNEKKYVKMLQKQLNSQMEHPEYDYAQRFTFYIINVFLITIYGFIVPTTTPILIVVFIASFWIDKFNIFNRYTTFGSFYISSGSILLLLIYVIVFTNAFYMFWIEIIKKEQPQLFRLSSIGSFLSLAYCWIRVKSWTSKSFYKLSDRSYSQCLKEGRFDMTYKMKNPMTQLFQRRAEDLLLKATISADDMSEDVPKYQKNLEEYRLSEVAPSKKEIAPL